MFILLVAVASAGRYAVLIAGSNYWGNYRHQADIFTIHKKLLSNGFKASEITMMCYDDIAVAEENPYTGKIFHTPDHKVNVYPGTHAIDYIGKTITAEHFYKVLKSVPSTKEDYVFVYYDDHGGLENLAVPEGCGNSITAKGLTATFDVLTSKCKYVLFGIEACASGSVGRYFDLPNLVTLTAANEYEPSYAAVYDSQLAVYLSNEFSYYWIAEMDDNPTETLGEFYENLKSRTRGSHAMYYGVEEAKELTIDMFFGKGAKLGLRLDREIEIAPQRIATLMHLEHEKTHGATSQIRMRASIELLKIAARSEQLEIVLDALVDELGARKSEVSDSGSQKIAPSYFEVLKHFISKFGAVNPDEYDRFMIINSLCVTYGETKVLEAIDKVL